MRNGTMIADRELVGLIEKVGIAVERSIGTTGEEVAVAQEREPTASEGSTGRADTSAGTQTGDEETRSEREMGPEEETRSKSEARSLIVAGGGRETAP